MDIFALRSTRFILQMVMDHDGEFTWYNIVTRTDRAGVEKHPPPFAVLEQLANDGYLSRNPPDNSNESRYWITAHGRQLLASVIDG